MVFRSQYISFPSMKNGESTYHEEAWDQAHMWDVDKTSFTFFHFKVSAFFAWLLAWESNINPHPYFASCQELALLQSVPTTHKRHPLSSVLCERVHNDFITTDLSTRSHCSNAICTRITSRSVKTSRFITCHVGCKIRCAEGKANAFEAIHLFKIHTLKTQPLTCCVALLNVGRRKGKEPRSNMTGCRAG